MVTDVLAALDARQSFGMVASALKQRNLSVSTGWHATAVRIEALAQGSERGELLRILGEVLRDNILYTNKAVLLWHVPKEIAEEIAAKLPSFVDHDSPYLANYPLPLPQEVLRRTTVLGVPTAIETSNMRKALVFASKRERVEQEPVPADQIPQQMFDAGFTEFYARKRFVFQVFDSFCITPSIGLIELRIDQAKYLSEKDVIQYRIALVEKFNSLVKSSLGHECILGAAINLEPALLPLYQGDKWVVHAIDHQNAEGYSNSNKGRNRTDDVRKDKYHLNGEAAVGGVQLWQVSASFSSDFTPHAPRLILEGNSRMLSSLSPFMDIARILDCATEAEYDEVLEALLLCLGITNRQEAAAPVVV